MVARRFEFQDAKSAKFWTVNATGTEFTVQFGRLGTKGSTKTKSCASPAAARAEVEKLVAEKLRKGYRETTTRKSSATSRKSTEAINKKLAQPSGKGKASQVLKKLTSVMPPPNEPVLANGDWDQVEMELRAPLPTDYREFITAYGGGFIGKLPLRILSPFGEFAGASLLLYRAQTKAIHDQLIQARVFEVPFPLFPEEGGLLQWGVTGNADLLYWRTCGKANNWHIVVCDGSNYRFQSFPKHNFTTFLHDVVVRKIKPFPTAFFNPTPPFSPYDLSKARKTTPKKRSRA